MKFILVSLLMIISFGTLSNERIISTAPNLTNIIKELGRGNLIVGRTNYCDLPKRVSITGTLYNFNFERALSLKPTLVVAPKTLNEQVLKKFEKLNLRFEDFEFESLSEIKDSILRLGKILNSSKKAKNLVKRMETIKKKSRDESALFIVSLQVQNGKVKDMYVAANGSLYEELISYNGLSVPFKDSKTSYLRVDIEKLMLINPKYIFFLSTKNLEEENLNSFKKISSLKAVKEGNVYAITEENMMTPDHNIVKLIDIIEGKIND